MLVNLRVLFGRLIDIALLRGGPETLPASRGLLAFVILLNAVVAVLVVALVPAVPPFSPLGLFVSTIVPLLWFQVAFALAKKPERFVQTMTALFGVNVMFQPVVTPLFAALLPYMQKQDPSMPPPVAMSLLFLIITVWLFIVSVRIVRAAFEWHYVAAIVFVLAQNLAVVLVIAMMVGDPPGKA